MPRRSNRRREALSRSAVTLVALMMVPVAVGATTHTPSPGPTPTPTLCSVARPTLVFTHIDIDPPAPVVGDSVFIDFGVCLENGSGGVFFFWIDGTAPFFSGETSMSGDSTFGIRCDEARFELQAVAAGNASLAIRASYEINIGCIDRPVFVFEYVQSDPFEIDIGVGTPQPTRTPTLAPTRTPTPSPTPHPSITVSPTVTPADVEPCTGDCDNSHETTVDEIVLLVNIALGNAAAATCSAGNIDGDPSITVDEILRSITALLDGCAFPSAE